MPANAAGPPADAAPQVLAVVAAGGERCALHTLGGAGPPLLLLHANGFCARVYQPMVDTALGRAFRVFALDMPGQGDSPRRASPPGSPGALAAYPQAAVEAVRTLRRLGLAAPGARVAVFGHSGGGLAALLAAAAAPALFSALYVYEPVAGLGEGGGSGLEAGAARRRRAFASRAAAAATFGSKPPLAAFDPAALEAYVEHGMWLEKDGTVTLKADPANEAAVYREAGALGMAAPAALGNLPVLVSRGAGADGDAGRLAEAAGPLAAGLAEGRLESYPDLGHLGPMEAPAFVGGRAAAALEAGGAGGRAWARVPREAVVMVGLEGGSSRL